MSDPTESTRRERRAGAWSVVVTVLLITLTGLYLRQYLDSGSIVVGRERSVVRGTAALWLLGVFGLGSGVSLVVTGRKLWRLARAGSQSQQGGGPVP